MFDLMVVENLLFGCLLNVFGWVRKCEVKCYVCEWFVEMGVDFDFDVWFGWLLIV